MDVLFEFLLKSLGWLMRIIWSLFETAVITRPWYWIGWCILKVVSFGKYPLHSINSESEEPNSIVIAIYMVGVVTPITVVLALFYIS